VQEYDHLKIPPPPSLRGNRFSEASCDPRYAGCMQAVKQRLPELVRESTKSLVMEAAIRVEIDHSMINSI